MRLREIWDVVRLSEEQPHEAPSALTAEDEQEEERAERERRKQARLEVLEAVAKKGCYWPGGD